MMRHRNYLHRVFIHSVNDTEREVWQHEPTRAVLMAFPPFRCASDFPYRPIHFRREGSRCDFTPFSIPSPRFQNLRLGFGTIKIYRLLFGIASPLLLPKGSK